MIKFILVDDNERHSKLVKKVIISYMMKNKLDFTIDIFNDDNKPLRDYIKNRKYDSIYILDIELPSGDGIEVARYIRNVINDWRSPIIFYTSYDNLLYDMYIEKMQILDFISKAVDIEPPLIEDLDLSFNMLNLSDALRFVYCSTEHTIAFNDINYIQRNDRNTLIFSKKNKHECNMSIKALKAQLPKDFMITNKGIIVNMRNIESLDWKTCKVKFKNGTSAYVLSKKHKKEIDKYYEK